MSTTVDDTPDQRFSVLLRERTARDHEQAEGAGLMAELVAGTLDRARIGDLLAQHLLVYRALEGGAARLVDDPVVAPFLVEGLARTAALEHDVALLLGPGAVDAPSPLAATADYVARLEEAAAWSGTFIAHHYTRYMGDLSGGIHIGRAVARAYPELDIRFYTFERITSPKAVKDGYRAALDAAPWTPAERERVVAEVHVAYDLNTRLLAELERGRPG